MMQKQAEAKRITNRIITHLIHLLRDYDYSNASIILTLARVMLKALFIFKNKRNYCIEALLNLNGISVMWVTSIW